MLLRTQVVEKDKKLLVIYVFFGIHHRLKLSPAVSRCLQCIMGMACSITLKNISLVCIFIFFCSDFVKRLICMLAYPCRTMLLNVPHTNCKKRKRKSYAPKMWNKLPLHIREATCVRHLRNYPTLFNMISLLINQRCLFFFILHIAFTSLFPKALLF